MCGIIGAVSAQPVEGLLVAALERLEYRGYDSAGVAVARRGIVTRRRAAGRIAALKTIIEAEPLEGTIGIGHTRWATHGRPITTNAHPHTAGRVTVVHNGIIENHVEMRRHLVEQGRVFTSETDTEVVAHFCDHLLDQGMHVEGAITDTIKMLRGSYALVLLVEGDEGRLFGAKKGSPLAVGVGDGLTCLGSDVQAMAPWIDRITYLEDGDLAVITQTGYTLTDSTGVQVGRLEWAVEGTDESDIGSFPHFMLKEIHDQARSLERRVASSLRPDLTIDPDLTLPPETTRLSIVGCGTARHAGEVARSWFEGFAGVPTQVEIASEYRYGTTPLSRADTAIFVSQSGETADTLAALVHAKGRVGKTIAVVNVTTSSLARAADQHLPIMAGLEIGVASTKAFTSQLVTLCAMALATAQDRGTLSNETIAAHARDLQTLPALVDATLARARPQLTNLIAALSSHPGALFLGRGPMAALAQEAALKVKELAYIYAEGYAAGEMKHGPIALVEAGTPVVVFAPHGPMMEKTISNMAEVEARGAHTFLITDDAGAHHATPGCETIVVPTCPPTLAPIVMAIVAQLIAYETALAKGFDVDKPRNLAKSVTVE